MTRTPATLVGLLAGLLLLPAASAQSVGFADFSDVSGLFLNGMAGQSGTALRVAPAGLLNKGSAYYNQPLILANGFDTTFTFRITNASSSGGSGMTFIIQNDAGSGPLAIGDHAWAMGYAEFPLNPGNGINDSLVLELDTFLDANQLDPSHSHLSLHTNGSGDNQGSEAYSLGNWSTPSDMSDGAIHTVRIVYVPGNLSVYYDNSAAPVISVPYDFVTGGTWMAGGTVGGINLMPNGSAFVGWTAAMPNTTSQLQDHDVLSWTWSSTVPPAYPGNGADSRIQVSLNGLPSLGSGGVHTVAPSDLFGLTFLSPGGTLEGQPFAVAASVFTTGMPPAGIPAANVWVDPFSFFLLLDGISPTTPFAPTLAPGGFDFGPFPVLSGFSGTSSSVILQLVTVSGGVGLSDGVELRFQ